MLWAQITLLIFTIVSFAASMYGAGKSNNAGSAVFIGTIIGQLLGFALLWCAGSFDLIF